MNKIKKIEKKNYNNKKVFCFYTCNIDLACPLIKTSYYVTNENGASIYPNGTSNEPKCSQKDQNGNTNGNKWTQLETEMETE